MSLRVAAVPSFRDAARSAQRRKVASEPRRDRQHVGYVKCCYLRVLGTGNGKNKDAKAEYAGFADPFLFLSLKGEKQDWVRSEREGAPGNMPWREVWAVVRQSFNLSLVQKMSAPSAGRQGIGIKPSYFICKREDSCNFLLILTEWLISSLLVALCCVNSGKLDP